MVFAFGHYLHSENDGNKCLAEDKKLVFLQISIEDPSNIVDKWQDLYFIVLESFPKNLTVEGDALSLRM